MGLDRTDSLPSRVVARSIRDYPTPQAMSVAVDFVIKLGGSALTIKDKLETPHPAFIRNCALQVQQARRLGRVCIVHGAGSFGHFQASKYNVSHGAVHPEYHRGVAETRCSVLKLHSLILAALVEAGVPAIGLSPWSSWTTSDRVVTSSNSEHIARVIRAGFVPVLHGDVCIDSARQFTILGGDRIVQELVRTLRPKQVIFVSDIEALFTKPPTERGARPIRGVPVPSGSTGVTLLAGVNVTKASHDVTNGIAGKVEAVARMMATDAALRVSEATDTGALPTKSLTVSIVSCRGRSILQVCGVVDVTFLLTLRGTHFYVPTSGLPNTVTLSTARSAGNADGSMGEHQQAVVAGEGVAPGATTQAIAQALRSHAAEGTGVGVGAGAGAGAGDVTESPAGGPTAASQGVPRHSREAMAMAASLTEASRIRELQEQVTRGSGGKQLKNQRRLAWYDDGPGRELRLSMSPAFPHNPVETKRLYCGLCGHSVREGTVWRRKGRRTSIRCSCCLVNLCFRPARKGGRSCWEIFHTHLQLPAKGVPHSVGVNDGGVAGHHPGASMDVAVATTIRPLVAPEHARKPPISMPRDLVGASSAAVPISTAAVGIGRPATAMVVIPTTAAAATPAGAGRLPSTRPSAAASPSPRTPTVHHAAAAVGSGAPLPLGRPNKRPRLGPST